ncbi:MAG: cell division protein ZapA [Flavobacteriales bacterium]|nr:cell division protein ZapA [Flavobacteriales bacterium]MCB9197019.1 cell division protein ZapA [Flavobacteriales bacterium]
MSSQSIKVNIAGRVYPLTIDPQEEEVIRKAAERINANIKELQESYAVRDMQDLLAMTALQYATEVTKGAKSVEYNQLLEDLKKLSTSLS